MASTSSRITAIARYFDERAERWDAEHGPASARAAAFRACVDYLAGVCRELGRPRVLDVGCASGQHLLHLAPEIRAGVGVDVAPRMIERARTAAGRHGVFRHLRFEVADAARLAPARLGRFDLVLFVGALEHVPNRQRALRAAAGLLDPGGRVIVIMPERVQPRYGGNGARPDGPPRIFASDRHFTADELARHARRAGLVAEGSDRLPNAFGPGGAIRATFALRLRRADDA